MRIKNLLHLCLLLVGLTLLLLPITTHAGTYGQCAYGSDAYGNCTPATSHPTSKAKKSSTGIATTTDDSSPSPEPTISSSPLLTQTAPDTTSAAFPTEAADSKMKLILGSFLALLVSAGLIGFIVYRKLGHHHNEIN